MRDRIKVLLMLGCNVSLCLAGGAAMLFHGARLQRLQGELDYSRHRAAIASLRSQSCNRAFESLLKLAENETGELVLMAAGFRSEGRLFFGIGIALLALAAMTTFVARAVYVRKSEHEE